MSSIRPWRDIERRKSRQIMVGKVPVGGDAPITVQTMTNTLTSDARATIDQIRRCEDAGADLIRVSCPDEASTAAMPEIVRAARIPVIADIHFHYKRALEAAAAVLAAHAGERLAVGDGEDAAGDRELSVRPHRQISDFDAGGERRIPEVPAVAREGGVDPAVGPGLGGANGGQEKDESELQGTECHTDLQQ